MNNKRIREIEERCNKATEGPWISFVEDRDFIANARQDIPWLIDKVRRLKKILNDLGYNDGTL